MRLWRSAADAGIGAPMTTARVIQVIETQSLRGDGTPANPMRHVKEYWDFDGAKLAECDPEIELQKLRAPAQEDR